MIRKSTGTSKYADAELMLHSEKKLVKEGKQSDAVTIANHTFEERQ